jgi:hypothetical protein
MSLEYFRRILVLRRSCRAIGMRKRFRRFIRLRSDEGSPAGCRGEHAVISDEVESGRRNQGCQLLDQLEGFEDDVVGAVAPAASETIQQAAVGQ